MESKNISVEEDEKVFESLIDSVRKLTEELMELEKMLEEMSGQIEGHIDLPIG